MRSLITRLLRIYQATLSPDHGLLRWRYPYGCCRFTPTCSAYAISAITKHGVAYGLRLTALRLLRCHPWAAGGSDAVPIPPRERAPSL